jgi:hypothetical protein
MKRVILLVLVASAVPFAAIAADLTVLTKGPAAMPVWQASGFVAP